MIFPLFYFLRNVFALLFFILLIQVYFSEEKVKEEEDQDLLLLKNYIKWDLSWKKYQQENLN
jgi:hypothetical protein